MLPLRCSLPVGATAQLSSLAAAAVCTVSSSRQLCSLLSLRALSHRSPVAAPGRRSPCWRSARCYAGSPELLKGVDPDHREEVARIIDQAERASKEWGLVVTDFYTPPIVADAMAALSQLADVRATPWGGYPQAERCRLLLGRAEGEAGPALDDPAASDAVALLSVRGNFMFDPATHRDFLGAVLGTGIERSRVGDIVVQGEAGAQMLVAPQLVEHLELALTQVRSVPVQARRVPLGELAVRAPKVEELRSVEASLRLDAVASAGFRIPRGKASDLIKSGDVRVNWKGAVKASASVKAGDVISCSGKGRVEVREVSQTKKGRYVVEMVRYV